MSIKYKPIRWITLIAIALLLCTLIVYPSVKKRIKARQEVAAAPANTATGRQRVLNINAEVITPHQMTDRTVTTGNILPAEEVNLSFETSGKIVGLYFEEGAFVKKGTLLAKINDAPLQAQLRKLEVQVKLASDRVYRQQTLLERDAVSQEAYESVLTDYNKLQADIEQVKAEVDLTELKAPFDGVIGLRYVSEGAFASASTTVATLSQVSVLKIDFSVPETYASEIRKGTPIQFMLTDDSGRERVYHANVYAVESSIDTDTRTLRVRALYTNRDGSLIPGRYISVELTRQVVEDALSVPSEAIIPEMGTNIVYVYRSGLAQPVTITTGLRTENRVQVLDGLQAGDTLITTGVMQLRRDLNVSIENLVENPFN